MLLFIKVFAIVNKSLEVISYFDIRCQPGGSLGIGSLPVNNFFECGFCGVVKPAKNRVGASGLYAKKRCFLRGTSHFIILVCFVKPLLQD